MKKLRHMLNTQYVRRLLVQSVSHQTSRLLGEESFLNLMKTFRKNTIGYLSGKVLFLNFEAMRHKKSTGSFEFILLPLSQMLTHVINVHGKLTIKINQIVPE